MALRYLGMFYIGCRLCPLSPATAKQSKGEYANITTFLPATLHGDGGYLGNHRS